MEKIYLGCRSEEKAKAAKYDLEQSTGRSIFEIMLLDVSDLGSVRSAVASIGPGLKTIVDPTSMMVGRGVAPQGLTGLNSLRSMLSGILPGSGMMMAIGLWKINPAWFLATALIMGVVAFGRILSFVLDGFDASSVPPAILELVILAVLVLAERRFTKESFA